MTSVVDEIPHGLRDLPLPTVLKALEALRRGEPVIVGATPWAFIMVDARMATPRGIASLIRHGSGLLHVALDTGRMRALDIPPMPVDSDSLCPQAHVAVDAKTGVTTGISATDRAETIRRLSNSDSRPGDFVRPGHVLPVAAQTTPSSTPADLALALSALTGASPPASAFCALVSVTHPTDVAGASEAKTMADEGGYTYLTVEDVVSAFYHYGPE
ncbi:MAG: 3,4-dihydroxy-2-butanone-4-phosphate synthase [Actinomycetota bacterium]